MIYEYKIKTSRQNNINYISYLGTKKSLRYKKNLEFIYLIIYSSLIIAALTVFSIYLGKDIVKTNAIHLSLKIIIPIVFYIGMIIFSLFLIGSIFINIRDLRIIDDELNSFNNKSTLKEHPFEKDSALKLMRNKLEKDEIFLKFFNYIKENFSEEKNEIESVNNIFSLSPRLLVEIFKEFDLKNIDEQLKNFFQFHKKNQNISWQEETSSTNLKENLKENIISFVSKIRGVYEEICQDQCNKLNKMIKNHNIKFEINDYRDLVQSIPNNDIYDIESIINNKIDINNQSNNTKISEFLEIINSNNTVKQPMEEERFLYHHPIGFILSGIKCLAEKCI